MKEQELLARYKAGERDFSGVNLAEIAIYGSQGKEVNLSGCNFSNADFSQAILSHVNFSHVNLSNANLQGARLNGYLDDSNLSGANLEGAKFSPCRLIRGNLSHANLSYANFGGSRSTNLSHADLSYANCLNAQLTCTLNSANFQGANLQGVIFRHPNLYWYRASLREANLRDADLSGISFADLDLRGANFSGSNLSEANLERANLDSANLRSANLNGANLNYVNWFNTQIEDAIAIPDKIYLVWQIVNQGVESKNLEGTDLSYVNLKSINLQGINLSQTNLEKINFSQANLNGTNLSQSNLSGAVLNSANLENADLSNSNLTGTNFTVANLTGANLSNSNLFGAFLANCQLIGANLTGAILTDANLENANLSNSNLTDTNLRGANLFNANLSNIINYSSIFSNSPENPNLELLQAIKKASESESYSSESNYPYQVFLWEVTQRGKFSLFALLELFGHIREISFSDFSQGNIEELEWLKYNYQPNVYFQESQEIIVNFRRLIPYLEYYLTNLQVYRLLVSNICFYLLIGNTPTNDCLGISIKVSSYLKQQHYSSPIFLIKDMAVSKQENRELVVALEDIIPNLRFSSDYLQGLVWEIAETKERLIQNLLDSAGIITINEKGNVFASEEQHDLVVNNLNNLRVYRFTAREIDVYIVGETNNGDWIGLNTKAVET